MKWTYDWLKDYLKTDLSAADIADTLTRTGLEVEDLIQPIPPIAAKIISCTPHENSDHLHVLMVDDGSGTPRQVVCGAPNARAGLVSALAVPGCVIAGHEIQSGKLRGVLSDGMMCSGRELGINDDHSGIVELPADTVIGSPVIDAKTVFDAGITPNRPDYLAVRGIAHDLAAAGAGEYIAPVDETLSPVKSGRGVNITTDKCPIYQLCEIHNIKMAKSNQTISARLAAIGINPKNAPVDATNYICYDMGQPMHCFDADAIVGNITVRMAQMGEKFTDLFGNEHSLTDADLVVADDAGVLALAGVVGGARGATTDNTKNIILESAYFDPVCVRKTSKRLGISTDASYRYERGTDPTITGAALARAARIIMDACGGEIVGTAIGGAVPEPRPGIKYTPSLFAKKTGCDMPAPQRREILNKLGFAVVEKDGAWTIMPRPARVDVVIAENIVSELIRIYGYDNIARNAVRRPDFAAPHHDYFMAIKSELSARGLNECKSFGFGNSATEKLISDKAPIMLANPITNEMDTARGGLLGNILGFVAENEKRGYPDLNMYELGTVFDGGTPGAQHTQICIVRSGDTAPRHWTRRNRPHDIYDVKADLIALMHGQNFTVSSDMPPRWAHPYRYGAIFQGKKKIAEFGQLHPNVAHAMKIKTNVCIAIVDDVANLPTGRRVHDAGTSEFQPITRDFAFIVDDDFPAEKLVAVARGVDNRITDAVIFDAFDMGNSKKSIAFTITIIPTENMTDGDLLNLQNAVINAATKKCGAQIRDK